MADSTLKEDYPYAVKVVTVADYQACGNRYFLAVYPPEDMLECKEIYTRLHFRFMGGVAPADQIIERVGVSSDYPDFILDDPVQVLYLDKQFTADANGHLELSLDLTPYIQDPAGANFIELQFAASLFSSGGWGIFDLWQVDMVYTTQGVRTKTA
jgi:hypothetical protein